MMFDQLRKTSSNKLAGMLQILPGIVFFTAGILKIVVPFLSEAFSSQLVAGNMSLHGLILSRVV